jgi:hypothetical protein
MELEGIVATDTGGRRRTVEMGEGTDERVGVMLIELKSGTVVVLGAGTATIGKLGANSGVDIGDVTINNAAGNPVPVLVSALSSIEVTQDTPDDLACNANLQVGDADVSESNPVPIATGVSAWQTFTIPDGANGGAVAPADLGANYKAILIRCADCQYIPASTNLSMQASEGAADTMCDVYEVDDPSTLWSKGSLPTSGTLRVVVTHAFGARRVRLVLSNNSTGGDTAFSIAGMDQGV